MSTTVVTDNAANYFQALNPGNFHFFNFGLASAQSAQLDATTTLVKLFATQDCWVAFGTNPTAAVGSAGVKGASVRLRGGFASYFGVPRGQGYKIAAIQDSQGGVLDILEGA